MTLTRLDRRVPPPVVFLLSAGLAWLLRWLTPIPSLAFPGRAPLAAACALAGVVLGLWSVLVFHRAHTTIDPHFPDRTRAIVRTGPYRISRNPMYLGLAFILLAFCMYLGNATTLLAPAAFVAYLTHFQIHPEERALLEKFGEPYARYLRRVRRWL